jgi:2,3-dihydroxybenzoate decarboxylase
MPEQEYLRIATEEAFATRELLAAYRELLDAGYDDPGFRSLWGFYLSSDSERARFLRSRLVDLGEQRLADMEAAGVDRQILSLTAPGPQVFDADRGASMAALANDQLAQACRRYPGRFYGLTAIAPQNPSAAVAEIERGARELGFKGVILNSHTRDEYFDDSKFWPIFEAAEALDTPIYLHPNSPSRGLIGPLLEAGLDGAIFGFGIDTGLSLLRIIVSGVFGRFPGLRIVVGHLGEALPFWMSRLDYMHAATVRSRRYPQVRQLDGTVSDYLRRNVWVTTSGMAWAPAIMFVRDVLGGDRVLYAMDYPYQYVPEEVTVQDNLPLSPADKKAFFELNAQHVFRL